jgi:hypothetical protein
VRAVSARQQAGGRRQEAGGSGRRVCVGGALASRRGLLTWRRLKRQRAGQKRRRFGHHRWLKWVQGQSRARIHYGFFSSRDTLRRDDVGRAAAAAADGVPAAGGAAAGGLPAVGVGRPASVPPAALRREPSARTMGCVTGWSTAAADLGRAITSNALSHCPLIESTGYFPCYFLHRSSQRSQRGRADDATAGGPEGGTHILAAACAGATTATATAGALAATATAGGKWGMADQADRADRADGHATALWRSGPRSSTGARARSAAVPRSVCTFRACACTPRCAQRGQRGRAKRCRRSG